MSCIEAENISLGYGPRQVVKGITFSLPAGRMTGLVGPNGSGKTTIIKALSRVIAPQGGRVLLDGRDVREIPRRELACLLGVVPQIPLLPGSFTAFEVVLMGRNPHLGLLRYEGRRDMEIAMQAMRQTGIAHLAGRRIGELSGGEIQCVVIARVLTQQPRIILMDEPTANLDVGRQIEILDLMQGLCRREGLTVGVALHDLNLAVQYCSQMVLLSDGGIQAAGTPREVVSAGNIEAAYGPGSVVHYLDGLPAVLPRAGTSRNA